MQLKTQITRERDAIRSATPGHGGSAESRQRRPQTALKSKYVWTPDTRLVKGNIAKTITHGAKRRNIDAFLTGRGRFNRDDAELQGREKPEPDKYQQAAIDEDKAIGGGPAGLHSKACPRGYAGR
jgi:hypothetical protein